MPGGFAQSPLRLNQGLGALPLWNEETIRARAAKIGALAADVWSAPKLDAAVLDAYRPKATVSSTYTIDDHPHFAAGAVRELFEALRKAVLALDDAVTEEFKKLYVAYKAETNFVDVIPQAKRLVLSLNISIHELDDPRGIAKDVSGMGRWGNGDVNVALAAPEELPYVMGLIAQAFEQQMAPS
jgi:predicted transport protein